MKKLYLSLIIFTALLLSATPARSDGGDYRHNKAATAISGAATLNNISGTITTESLTTAAGAVYTLTLSNSKFRADTILNVTVDNGTNTQGIPVRSTVHCISGSAVIKIANLHASQALNGTLKVQFDMAP